MTDPLTGVLLQALQTGRQAFDAGLAAFGVPVDWRRRSAAVAGSGGAISMSAGVADPVDSSWVRDIDNPAVYEPMGSVLVAKDIPGATQGEEMGKMLTGVSMAYARWDSGIGAGDVLIIDGAPWYVDGATVAQPAVYLQMTLRRG